VPTLTEAQREAFRQDIETVLAQFQRRFGISQELSDEVLRKADLFGDTEAAAEEWRTLQQDLGAMAESIDRLCEGFGRETGVAMSFANAVQRIVRIIKPVTKALRWLHRRPCPYRWRTRRHYRMKRQRRF
jgi:hypothetical protein